MEEREISKAVITRLPRYYRYLGEMCIRDRVYKGRFLLQNTVLMSLGNSVNHVVHIFVALTDVHIVTDTDHVCHEGNHIGSFTYSLAVGNLGFALIQVLNLQAQQVAGGSEGETGSGRVVAEQGDP